MKKALFLILFAAISGFAFAQAANPVSWTFTSKKLSETVYEVHLVANIQPGWHLYSQNQPQDAIALPTAFSFNKNPLLLLDGTVKELGKLEKFKDDKLGISANQFSQKVDFVQKIKVKGKVKTNVTGKLEYQTCDDKKCLPPKTVNFTIALS
jgi:thiol:disulfide interchange protein DsbD